MFRGTPCNLISWLDIVFKGTVLNLTWHFVYVYCTVAYIPFTGLVSKSWLLFTLKRPLFYLFIFWLIGGWKILRRVGRKFVCLLSGLHSGGRGCKPQPFLVQASFFRQSRLRASLHTLNILTFKQNVLTLTNVSRFIFACLMFYLDFFKKSAEI